MYVYNKDRKQSYVYRKGGENMSKYKYAPQYNKNSIKYQKEKLEQFKFNLPKGEKAVWMAYAASKGSTVTTMIKEYFRGRIEADGFTVPEASEEDEKEV